MRVARNRSGRSWKDIPRGVWALGLVSMFMDISSEMIHALLPIYMVSVLGASMVTVGFIEGLAEATAMITKLFSGALSDWLGRRKLLAAIGYGLAAFTKPVFPLATSIDWFVGARFVDRIGKGIRGAPRDALVADITPEQVRGASFGLRQSLDTIGAFVGPLLAIGLMLLTMNNFKLVFWFAVIPAFIALALMVFGVKEPERKTNEHTGANEQDALASDAIGQRSCRIRHDRVDDVHHDHDRRNQRDGQAHVLRLQHEERLAEASQHEGKGNRHHGPESTRETLRIAELQTTFAAAGLGLTASFGSVVMNGYTFSSTVGLSVYRSIAVPNSSMTARGACQRFGLSCRPRFAPHD